MCKLSASAGRVVMVVDKSRIHAPYIIKTYLNQHYDRAFKKVFCTDVDWGTRQLDMNYWIHM